MENDSMATQHCAKTSHESTAIISNAENVVKNNITVFHLQYNLVSRHHPGLEFKYSNVQ